MIEVSQVVKRFPLPDGRTLDVLRSASMSVASGEAVAIMGASGSGKTTLLHVIAGLESFDEGSISLGGDSRRPPGLVFQHHYLLPELSAVENVALAARLAGASKREALLLAEELLVQLGLKERLNHMLTELSGGEIARAAIARSLASGSDVILADEPTGSLDEDTSEVIQKVLFEVVRAARKTIVIVTHDQLVATRADRVLTLKNGHLMETPPKAVLTR